jgi:hypothetical protein
MIHPMAAQCDDDKRWGGIYSGVIHEAEAVARALCRRQYGTLNTIKATEIKIS